MYTFYEKKEQTNKHTMRICTFVKRSKIILQRIYTFLRSHIRTLILLVSAGRFKSRNVENDHYKVGKIKCRAKEKIWTPLLLSLRSRGVYKAIFFAFREQAPSIDLLTYSPPTTQDVIYFTSSREQKDILSIAVNAIRTYTVFEDSFFYFESNKKPEIPEDVKKKPLRL